MTDPFIGQADIDAAKSAVDAVEALAPETRELLSNRVVPVLHGFERLRAGVKKHAAMHGVRGATGAAHPSIEEVSQHIDAVMRGWMERAGARASLSHSDRIATARAEIVMLAQTCKGADRDALALLLQDVSVVLDANLEERAPVTIPAVDRNAVTTTDGRSADEVRIEQRGEAGMHKSYIVLSDEERAKGFVRPVRQSYVHEKCGTNTRMGLALAETYARDPKFYGATFCCGCNAHFPVGEEGEFIWADGDRSKVGT